MFSYEFLKLPWLKQFSSGEFGLLVNNADLVLILHATSFLKEATTGHSIIVMRLEVGKIPMCNFAFLFYYTSKTIIKNRKI